MKKASIVIAVVICSLYSCSQDVTKLEKALDVYTRQYKFNGTVLVVHKGKVIFNKGYGFRNAKDSILHNVNSIFQIGSITKQFTSTVILKLQEEKKLNVKDKLSKY